MQKEVKEQEQSLERVRLAEVHKQHELDKLKAKLIKHTKAAKAREGLVSPDPK